VSQKPDLIVALPNAGVAAAKQATSTIPIVMVYVFDPINYGLVASLARPGSNVTGLTFDVGPEIVGKYLELLKQVSPNIPRVAVAGNPELWPGALAAAQLLGMTLHRWELRSAAELEGDALLVLPYPRTYAHTRRIVQLAEKHQLPAVYPFREAVEAGGLMAYGPNAPDMFRRAGIYIDKIFRGAKPADLPVEQPTKFELVINLKTAKALGLTIPPSLLLRADQVIDR
jgi:putative tryptophan/tyrosine transport system substrate-binding protein